MTSIRVAIVASLIGCLASNVVAQESTATDTASSDEVVSQKHCADKATHDRLKDSLRPTFMLECVVNAKLDAPGKNVEHK